MKIISYLETNGVGTARFEDTKAITPHDLMLETLVIEEGKPVLPEYPGITHKMMFDEYKKEPLQFVWALVKTAFRAVMWFISNVFMRLLIFGIQGAVLTVIYQTAIGKTFSEGTIFHEFWHFTKLWMLILGVTIFARFLLRMTSFNGFIPRWKNELWIPPFIVLWELHNGELVAHHYHTDLKQLSSNNYVEFKNMTYESRFVLGYMNNLIDIEWPLAAIVLDDNDVKAGEYYPEGPDMLYLTELSLATYDLNNPDQRGRLEKERLAYQNETIYFGTAQSLCRR